MSNTLPEILDYADPNHPTGFWRKKQAQERIYEAMLEIIGENPEHRDYCDLMTTPIWTMNNPEDICCTCDFIGINERLAEQRKRAAVFCGKEES